MKISHVIFNSKKILVTTLPMLHGLPIRLHTTWYDLTLGLVPTWNALFSIPKFANIPFSPYGSEIGRSIYTNYLLLIPHGFVVENPPQKKKKQRWPPRIFQQPPKTPKPHPPRSGEVVELDSVQTDRSTRRGVRDASSISMNLNMTPKSTKVKSAIPRSSSCCRNRRRGSGLWVVVGVGWDDGCCW